MPTYHEALKINEQYAIDNQKEPSAIKILLLHFTKLKSAQLIDRLHDEMDHRTYLHFLKAVDQYVIKNRPIQHITETEYFFGYRFTVNHQVLIPRFETEELVAYTLDLKKTVFKDKAVSLLDLGTGSGCLAITLSLEDPSIKAEGSDISQEAIEIAQHNATNLSANVVFHQGDLFKPLTGKKYDILISNPPYIPNGEKLEPSIKDFEPHIALYGGEDGLDYYRAIIKQAEHYLNNTYIIAFEHAYDKAKAIKKLAKKYLKGVRIIQKQDMQGKDRMTFIVKNA